MYVSICTPNLVLNLNNTSPSVKNCLIAYNLTFSNVKDNLGHPEFAMHGGEFSSRHVFYHLILRFATVENSIQAVEPAIFSM